VAKVKFKSSIEDVKRAAKENKSSPDLTHVRVAKAGDTLPNMCHEIYGDPAFYFRIAEWNGLGNFRSLQPGTRIEFPPLARNGTAK
jgi:nucleoid-associated protein YgaU